MNLEPISSFPRFPAMGSPLPSSAHEVQQPSQAREVAESFASYLYAQVFSQMRPEDSGEEGGLFSGEQAGMFLDFLDQALGQRFASTGGNRLVEQLTEQLSRSLEGTQAANEGHRGP
ncbi:MAG: rod-binding protein [bacterium]|nr:rod-binding protein [bacterium]